MEFTTHALRRCDQRAIPRALAELIVKTGDEYKCGQSRRIIIARSKNAHKELVKELQMIGINMGIPRCVDKLSGFQITYLCQHQCQKGIRGNIKGHAEEYIGTTLIELT